MTSSTSFFISSVSSEARETDRGQEEKTLTGQHTGTLPAEQSTWHIYRKTPRAHQKETGTGGIVCPCFSCHHSIFHSLHKTCNKAITLLLTSARTGCIFPDTVFSCRHTLPPSPHPNTLAHFSTGLLPASPSFPTSGTSPFASRQSGTDSSPHMIISSGFIRRPT